MVLASDLDHLANRLAKIRPHRRCKRACLSGGTKLTITIPAPLPSDLHEDPLLGLDSWGVETWEGGDTCEGGWNGGCVLHVGH